MTCRDCEVQLADGALNGEAEDHLRICAQCQALAAELRENAIALASMRDEELVEQLSVRNASFSRRPRRPIWIGAAAAGILLLALASLQPRHSTPAIASPISNEVAIDLPQPPAPALIAAITPDRRAEPRRLKPPAQPLHEETVLVKMLTPDPDVVVYWIVDNKERAE
jgi:hypothetical protein